MKRSNEELVQTIFQACAELSRRSGRSVSPDGHLVGSLGEIYAAHALGLRLENASNAGFDALDSEGEEWRLKPQRAPLLPFRLQELWLSG